MEMDASWIRFKRAMSARTEELNHTLTHAQSHDCIIKIPLKFKLWKGTNTSGAF